MKKIAAIAVLAFLFVGLALAHGGNDLMGVVKAISNKSLTVEGEKGKTTTITILASTRFVKSGEPASAKDLKAGDRVVVEVGMASGGMVVAVEVRFGPPKK